MIVEGSRIDGNRVLITAGRDLTMTSLQDKDIYTNSEKYSGLQVSYNFDVLSGSPLHSKTTMNSSHQSVTEQVGIYAGEGGYNIAVGDTTRLTGAVIGSKGDSSQNVITTKSLYTSDIENTAEYKAASSGGNGLVGVVSDTLGKMSVSGQSSSTTRSAIADGMIISAQGDSIDTIYRNTEEALQALKPIFDKQTVEEKLALTQILSEEGFKLVGDIATKQYIQNIQKAQEATSEAEEKRYREEANKWGDGGAYKIGLHTLVGAGLGQFTGHGAITGAVSAGTNEALQPALSQIDNEELHKLASLVIGNVVTGSIFGGATALEATKFNWLSHANQINYARALYSAKDMPMTQARIHAFYGALDQFNDATYGPRQNYMEEFLSTAIAASGVNVEDSLGLTYNINKAISTFSVYYPYGDGFSTAYGYRRYINPNTRYSFDSKEPPYLIQYENLKNPGTIPDEIFGRASTVSELLNQGGYKGRNGYFVDYKNNERRDLGLVGDYLLANGAERVTNSGSPYVYARTDNGDYITSEINGNSSSMISNSDKYLDSMTTIATTAVSAPFEVGATYADLPNVAKAVGRTMLVVDVGVNAWRNSETYSGKDLWKATTVDTTGNLLVLETGAILTQLLLGDIKTTAKVTIITVEGVNLWRIWNNNNIYDKTLDEIKDSIAIPDKEEN